MLGQLVVPRQCNNEVLCNRCSLLLPGAPVATQLPDSFLWFAYIIMFASTMYIGNVLDLHTHDLVTYSVIPLTSDMTYSVTCHMTTHHMTYSVTRCTWSPDVQCSCMLCARYRDFCGVWDHRPLPPSLLCLLMSGVYPPHYTWSAFNIPQYYVCYVNAIVDQWCLAQRCLRTRVCWITVCSIWMMLWAIVVRTWTFLPLCLRLKGEPASLYGHNCGVFWSLCPAGTYTW